MKASVDGAIAQLQALPGSQILDTGLEQMYLQKSLRSSAWRLAAESGYLLHADFELATDIGALIDFQTSSYQSIVLRMNDAVFDKTPQFSENPIEYYVKTSGLIDEWIAQTNYLNLLYDSLFEREEFEQLACG
jgi:hypothetical protein